MSISEIIRKRRSIYPASYLPDQVISKEVLTEILENAHCAPSHRKTFPWRFVVYTGAGKEQLSEFLGECYKIQNPGELFSDVKFKKSKESPLKSAAVIAICVSTDPSTGQPEWEEIAATSCAVQNMWLTCTEKGIGSYWSTPGAIGKAQDFLGLGEHERCIGLFYMGISNVEPVEVERPALSTRVKWVD
jgi:nitroreductase